MFEIDFFVKTFCAIFLTCLLGSFKSLRSQMITSTCCCCMQQRRRDFEEGLNSEKLFQHSSKKMIQRASDPLKLSMVLLKVTRPLNLFSAASISPESAAKYQSKRNENRLHPDVSLAGWRSRDSLRNLQSSTKWTC